MDKTQNHRRTIEQWLAVGGGWRLVAVGGWWFLGAVLNKKDFLRTALITAMEDEADSAPIEDCASSDSHGTPKTSGRWALPQVLTEWNTACNAMP